MSISYPTSLDTFTNPATTDKTNSPSHAGQHDNANDAIVQLETKIGTGSSTPASGKVLHGTGAGASAWAAASLTADVTGTLPTANGGTGTTTLTFPGGTDTLVARATTDTLTNKRVTKRAPAITQSATPAINTDVTDVAHITGLAQAITSMTSSLTGTPVEGDTLRIDITDNGTARAITWGASFESSGNVTLPTTTVISTRLDVGFVWNSVTSKWRCVAVA